MQPKSLNSYLGLVALWLLLASGSLGAPTDSTIYQLLRRVDAIDMTVCGSRKFYIPPPDTELQSKACFIHGMNNLWNCPKMNSNEVEELILTAESVFDITLNSMNIQCDRYRSGSSEEYKAGLKLIVQRFNIEKSHS